MQLPKIPRSIVVTASGIVNEVKPVHPSNADFSMVVTLLGITIEVSPMQFRNALFPIVVIPSGIVEAEHP